LRGKVVSLREANKTLATENNEAEERLAAVQLKHGQC
jgi:hypothetical protein